MTPLYFGATGRRLFGVYHAPRGAPIRRGVVLCYPIGVEYYSAHLACCALARQLAETGMDVLRFDYAGTGDSDGEVCDFVADDWIANVGQAVDELRDMTGLPKVALVGLRFGAVLALRSAQRRGDVDRIVLWDPALDPDACLGGPGRDLHSPELVAGLRRLAARGGEAPPSPTLLVATDPHDGEGGPPAPEIPGVTEVRRFIGPRIWEEEENFGSPGLPVRAMRGMAEWLAKPA